MPIAISREVGVPIARFGTKEARKIFDEVNKYGNKVVLDDSRPACVLVSPEKYCSMVDEIEEARLYDLVAERIERIENGTAKYIPFEEILAKEGLTFEDLDAMEDVEIE